MKLVLMTMTLVGISSAYPLHASCKLDWVIGKSCADAITALVTQANTWHDATNCPNGAGEKCLYTVTSQSNDTIKLTHETPVHHYIDDVVFTFAPGDSTDSCKVHGSSRSETWYAVLDYSTNYCNMRNLLEGANLHTTTGFRETTNDNICTQYSTRNCEKY
ncbi:uncharacterized protein LOC127856204 [Dreissena polymorpha]|uniref:uncharacterized protein LOC127856204 n=1 Tax=Dreissena polymorpha TaxID=45954 RepID=UPI002264BDC8|nr:uncharacterized protein LOC127856204 [Dreissena polymorpha]